MKVLESSLSGCVGSASLASEIGGERSGERKSWGGGRAWSGIGMCAGICACGPVCVRISYTCTCGAHVSMCSLSMSLCVHVHLCVCTHMWADGGAALLPVVQHLTPHTIRGIPAIPGTWPRPFWENGSFWEDGNVSFYGSVGRCCLSRCLSHDLPARAGTVLPACEQ